MVLDDIGNVGWVKNFSLGAFKVRQLIRVIYAMVPGGLRTCLVITLLLYAYQYKSVQ